MFLHLVRWQSRSKTGRRESGTFLLRPPLYVCVCVFVVPFFGLGEERKAEKWGEIMQQGVEKKEEENS